MYEQLKNRGDGPVPLELPEFDPSTTPQTYIKKFLESQEESRQSLIEEAMEGVEQTMAAAEAEARMEDLIDFIVNVGQELCDRGYGDLPNVAHDETILYVPDTETDYSRGVWVRHPVAEVCQFLPGHLSLTGRDEVYDTAKAVPYSRCICVITGPASDILSDAFNIEQLEQGSDRDREHAERKHELYDHRFTPGTVVCGRINSDGKLGSAEPFTAGLRIEEELKLIASAMQETLRGLENTTKQE